MSEGLTLLVLGMGTVFVFLTLLVVVTTAMSSLVMKYQPIAATAAPTVKAATAPDERKRIAVITAAIHQHRNHRQQ